MYKVFHNDNFLMKWSRIQQCFVGITAFVIWRSVPIWQMSNCQIFVSLASWIAYVLAPASNIKIQIALISYFSDLFLHSAWIKVFIQSKPCCVVYIFSTPYFISQDIWWVYHKYLFMYHECVSRCSFAWSLGMPNNG